MVSGTKGKSHTFECGFLTSERGGFLFSEGLSVLHSQHFEKD